MSQTMLAYVTIQSVGTSEKCIKSMTLLPSISHTPWDNCPNSFDNADSQIFGSFFSNVFFPPSIHQTYDLVVIYFHQFCVIGF